MPIRGVGHGTKISLDDALSGVQSDPKLTPMTLFDPILKFLMSFGGIEFPNRKFLSKCAWKDIRSIFAVTS